MKHLLTHLLILFSVALPLGAQDSLSCIDYVYLKDGSVYRGEIVEQAPGQYLTLRTWNDRTINFSDKIIRRVVQRCPEDKQVLRATRGYTFKEKGWYHATRGSLHIGRDIYGYNNPGLGLQHSSGYALKRMLALGIGIGAENFVPGDAAAGIYPIFLETRGYWKAQRVSPFHTLGLGWSFAGQQHEDRWGFNDEWKGGFMAQAQLGVRFGNHFTIHTGLRLQQAKRTWDQIWDNGSRGTDRILFQRLELGFGILL